MRRFLRDNGLSLVLLALFLLAAVGQGLAGWGVYNEEQEIHGEPQVGFAEYLSTPHFGEALAENWESEFLQMALFVILTAFLYQRGSAVSNPPPDEEAGEPSRSPQVTEDSPWPLRQPLKWVRTLYANSLAVALAALFVFSFWLHAWNGAREFSEEQIQHGQAGVSTVQYLGTSRFWFESFQNWQSEFLSVLVLAVLSIWLRQAGSPESKPLEKPHHRTGAE